MDPNETLRRLLLWAMADPESTLSNSDAQEAFLDLHEWMSKGGFSPTDWDHPYGDKAREEDRWEADRVRSLKEGK